MLRVTLSLALIASIAGSSPVLANSFLNRIFNEALTGFEEVPAISTPGGGRFFARIAPNGSAIAWELRYGNLESTVTQAHIHIENATNNGPIVVFLCSNLGNGPAGTQACPPQPASITGTIVAADVLTAGTSGIAAGEFAELIRAIRAGSTYVNVHTDLRPGGEVRSQLGAHLGHD
jgi:hypothetical protein